MDAIEELALEQAEVGQLLQRLASSSKGTLEDLVHFAPGVSAQGVGIGPRLECLALRHQIPKDVETLPKFLRMVVRHTHPAS